LLLVENRILMAIAESARQCCIFDVSIWRIRA